MRRCAPPLTAALIGLLLNSSPLTADEVRGYVISGASGERLADVEVAFYLQQGEQLDELLRKSTDSDGRFLFSGPFLASDVSFTLAAFYQGVPHFSSTLAVGGQQEIILEVYEPTGDDRQIRIASHLLFLNLSEASLEVVHLVQIDNVGELTYTGQGNGQVAEFILPAGVIDLQSLSGELTRASGTRFFSGQPLLPGTSQITFTFKLNPQTLEDGYQHQTRYPTDRFEVLLQPDTIQPGPPFEDLGSVDFHGSRYRRLLLNGLNPGQTVLVPLPLVQPLRWLFKWVALGVFLLSGIAALLLGRNRVVLTPAPSASADLQKLLERLARLDDEHVDRQDDPRYLTERTRLMDQALDLFRLQEERNGNE